MPNGHTPRTLCVDDLDARSRGQNLKGNIKEEPSYRPFEQIELQAKLLNYFLGSNKSNINQSHSSARLEGLRAERDRLLHSAGLCNY